MLEREKLITNLIIETKIAYTTYVTQNFDTIHKIIDMLKIDKQYLVPLKIKVLGNVQYYARQKTTNFKFDMKPVINNFCSD